MKTAICCLVILTAWLNFSCSRNVESSPISENEKPAEVILISTPQPAVSPEKYEEFDIAGQFAWFRNNDTPPTIEHNGFIVRRVGVTKSDEFGSPKAEIYDLIVTKNGKTVRRFEGSYNPLGNSLGFGLYQFLRNSEKQSFIVDESNRYDREWIVGLVPKFEVLFDTADFGADKLMVLDVDGDAEKEITVGRFCFESDFGFAMSDRPWVRVVFKYDSVRRKYLPASHIFTEYSLDGQEERIQKFKENPDKINGNKFSKLLEIFMTYVYAGQEETAWKFFDENFSDEIRKEEIKTKILKGIKKDRIYKFIRRDLTRKK
ncbi:MAG TPA: hypothetical protein VIL74_14195 [Pyrinomonadaceae bacterium]|jgi:hypothetical protein